MPYIDLGRVIGPQGEQGPQGPQGPSGGVGPAGPNQVTGATSTTLNGILQGNGATIQAIGTDAAPVAGSNNIVRSGAVFNALNRKVNPNLLRNWYLAGGGSGGGILPVNRQGKSSYQGPGYAIDGWHVRGTAIVALSAGGVSITAPVDTDFKGFSQSIAEVRNELIGKTVTVSALISNYNMSDHASYPRMGLYAANSGTTHTAAILTTHINGNGLFTATGVIPASISQYSSLNFTACYIASDTNVAGSMTIVAAKVELGESQTLAHQENGTWVPNAIPIYEEEFLKCQLNNSNTSDSSSGWMPAVVKVGANDRPYIRAYNSNGEQYQWVVAANGQLIVQKYDGSSWTTIVAYNPAT